ncbi:hypothetical protein [Gallaecimonas pentaromativorans]|uniref:Lipoprotein n=1 Tax=Gallaecimonas pentaromativorans TaxID=584787 RepID=A0A3N1PH14_9GAMM|nr:hypothetical protein [Gallaecimonas pentaromativorans]ROQ27359.1 hypothetical protein EDC28_1046 [Gallaecimonas pentaromativorans]
MNKIVYLIFLVVLVGCFPSSEESASMESYVKFKESYYSYYTQDMWDARLEYVLRTKYKPRKSIKSLNAEINIDEDSIVYRNGTDYKHFTKKELKIENEQVKLCDQLGCEVVSE